MMYDLGSVLILNGNFVQRSIQSVACVYSLLCGETVLSAISSKLEAFCL